VSGGGAAVRRVRGAGPRPVDRAGAGLRVADRAAPLRDVVDDDRDRDAADPDPDPDRERDAGGGMRFVVVRAI
jgi:hypothetical protein